ncbi:MAG TPA: 30S ribosomal protein S11 [Mesotoga sp.]|jgi:small subunit ribosomal protein S11|uniref:Small ribosomal subunit protein uS11 n=1 Tax=Mesotoga infera TaxID=1236046 RepID=A0A7Z7PQH4_9BACT|nr:30S ribosomal protein S11 [Mesotoga infera]MBP7200051.1 30S ribosomal protein S11 [Mesotoga sp.]MDI9376383.1 30S ribosomal protein S11 [Thermotogota bacterium]NLI06815.1 30S ribosomal protein S11 [Thermotogaceae bacterium]MBP8659551.1 30S ribosomal protein S11 [Mesotoga sp.]MDD4040476.1 30S ribosomal protein S11 [Mesotoga sp.]
MAKRPAAKKRRKLTSDKGIVHIKSSFNNTIITLTDPDGNTLMWTSGGTAGYSGSKKSTPYAAQLGADKIAKEAIKLGITRVGIEVKGPGSGREAAIRTIQAAGLTIETLKDITPLPHNGCRPRRRRRV